MLVKCYLVNFRDHIGQTVHLELPMDSGQSESVIKSLIHLGFDVAVKEAYVDKKGIEEDMENSYRVERERELFHMNLKKKYPLRRNDGEAKMIARDEVVRETNMARPVSPDNEVDYAD